MLVCAQALLIAPILRLGRVLCICTSGVAKKRAELEALRALLVGEYGEEVVGQLMAAAEPLRRVHECAFALRALESEPVDPRL